MACSCIACEIRQMLDRRFPNGSDADSLVEIGLALADVAGQTLAPAGEGSFDAFVKLLRGNRERHRTGTAGVQTVLHS